MKRANFGVQHQPIPMTYTSLFPYLIQDGRVAPRELKPVPGPPKPWFNENARCAFHANSPGHNIEDFFAFKCKVQELIDRKLSLMSPTLLIIHCRGMGRHQ